MRHTFWLWLLLLTACHNKSTKPNILNVDPIVAKDWNMRGSMSFSDGTDGGSGSIKWSEKNGQVHAIFKAPLFHGSWELDENVGEIKNSKGRLWVGSDMSALMEQQLGWEVPWMALKQSIKGVSGNVLIKSGKNSLSFTRKGWLIEWKNLKLVNGLWLPHKVFLKKAPFSVKVSVKSWSW